MHRWFFADDETKIKEPSVLSSSLEPTESLSTTVDVYTDWTFKVKYEKQLCCNETLAICGSCQSLGNWSVHSCLPLVWSENSSVWSLKISLLRKFDIQYRYLVCALNCRGERVVRFWETHTGARVITTIQERRSEPETFGLLNDELKIERGWLNSYVTVVQLKFYRAPFTLNASYGKMLLQLKITPIKLTDRMKCEKPINLVLDEPTDKCHSSADNMIAERGETFAYCEVAKLQEGSGKFVGQSLYGTPCGPDHLLMFHLTLADAENTGYLIDLYSCPPKSGPDVPPYRFGYQYVLPEELNKSYGTLQLIIMCGTKHRPIGYMKCDYLVVKATESLNFNMEKTFQRYWNSKHVGMVIGHRGCGSSFWFHKDILRENTIHSFKLACEHGADMIEFDVQLTMDLVPIIYHDMELYISTTLDVDNHEHDLMQLPLKMIEIEFFKTLAYRVKKNVLGIPLSKFTLEQLSRVKVFEPVKEVCDTSSKANQPFPTLKQVFKEIDIKTGFSIEIKWPQAMQSSKRIQPKPDFDKNLYVDKILKVVFDNAGSRRIIFSSFDADICTMVRLKQNLYPVLFLVEGHKSEIVFADPRGKMITTSICFANAMELLGIAVDSADISEAPETILDPHEKKLCLFSWGVENRTEKMRKYLINLGVNGIYADRINHALTPSDLKGNLFHIIDIEESDEANNTTTEA